MSRIICIAVAVILPALCVSSFGAQTSFGTKNKYAVGSSPYAVAVGDFNKANGPDIVVANFSSDTISVLLGNGDGTFQAAVNYNVGSGPQSIAVGDFNKDGNLDLAVANYGDGNVAILLGSATGVFSGAVFYDAGASADFVAAGDLNGDGKLDLVTANFDGSDVSVLIGVGDGTFQAAVHYSVGNTSVASSSGPNCIVLADFNGDGRLDLAAPKYFNNSVAVLLGNGDGTFQAGVDYPVGANPNIAVAGDLNGDGVLDLAVTNDTAGSVSILYGKGNGSFLPAVTLTTGNRPSNAAIADMNGDGFADLLIANSSQDNDVNSNVGILHGKGEGVFQALVPYTPAPQFPVATDGLAAFAVAVADFNKDNKPDMAVVYLNSDDLVVYLNSTTFLTPTTTATNNLTVTATTLAPQTVMLNATITASVGGPVNEGVVTFRVFGGGADVSTAVVTPTVANGTAGVSFSVPPNTPAGTYTIHAGYSGGAVFAASNDNSKTLTILPPGGGGGGNPPVVTNIDFSRNPVRTGVNVIMTATAVAPSGGQLSYEWFYFTSDGKQNGPSLVGNPVQRAFSAEGDFIVVVIANDGATKSAEFKNLKVSSLAPNPGALAKSVLTPDKITNNPVDKLGLRVPDSLGGVDDLDIMDGTSPSGAPGLIRAGEKFNLTIPSQNVTVQTSAGAGKFTQAGIYRVEATSADSTRKARLMVPVSGPEVGASSDINDQRASTGATVKMIKGKFTFAGKDTLVLSAEIELPANLSLRESQSFALGVSNISGDGTVDKRGKVTGFSNTQFKKILFKLPKVDKVTGRTKGGEKMRITITLLGTNLSAAGFDTEGISNNKLIPRGQAQQRQLQFATVIGGVAYFDLLPVDFAVTARAKSEFGTIVGRR